jgi:hypothetical protein
MARNDKAPWLLFGVTIIFWFCFISLCFAAKGYYQTQNPNELTTQYIQSEAKDGQLVIIGALINESSAIMYDLSVTVDGYDSGENLISSTKTPDYPALKYGGKMIYQVNIPLDSRLAKVILWPRSSIGDGRWNNVLMGR